MKNPHTCAFYAIASAMARSSRSCSGDSFAIMFLKPCAASAPSLQYVRENAEKMDYIKNLLADKHSRYVLEKYIAVSTTDDICHLLESDRRRVWVRGTEHFCDRNLCGYRIWRYRGMELTSVLTVHAIAVLLASKLMQ